MLIDNNLTENDPVTPDDDSTEENTSEEEFKALKYINAKCPENTRDRYTSLGNKHNMCFKMMKSDSRLVKTLLFSYGFMQIPQYYCTPLNDNSRAQLFKECIQIENGLLPPYIVKPASSSRGRDITFIRNREDVCLSLFLKCILA